MHNVDPRDGFEIWVIDPANGTAEQVELKTAPQAAQTPVTVKVEKPPAKNRQPRLPGTSAKMKKQPAPKTEIASPGTAVKKPRASKTAENKKRKPAQPRTRTRAKKPQLVATASVEATSTAVATEPKPTTRKPRPIRKKATPPKPAVAAPVPLEPSTAPAPREPVLVASAADLVNPSRIHESDALMVLELVCGAPAQPSNQPLPRQGSFEIRLVDIHQ
jgi:hypothetical protein